MCKIIDSKIKEISDRTIIIFMDYYVIKINTK